VTEQFNGDKPECRCDKVKEDWKVGVVRQVGETLVWIAFIAACCYYCTRR